MVNGKEVETRIDGFSEHPKNPLKVPDELFFLDEKTIDLSEIYGDTRRRKEKVRGLINVLESYKFTVDENTPIEEEVALDPELLGKVFENLLAAYNPETQTTARKQTGSFYTPREIVNYMVDESLIAYLNSRLSHDSQDSRITTMRQSNEACLRHLLSYNSEPHTFSPQEVEELIDAIDEIKILDPACGSGAFPMSILHKLVFILSKLDPENTRWRELQKQRAIRETEEAYKIGIKEERQRRLLDIDEAFENNASDYGRKLYLIENCIYGVDIQPIAVQIAKLRFFISLIVDQRFDPTKENFGVRPLPNLETKFVAANTLIGVEKPAQGILRNPQIDKLEAELKKVREQHFIARTLETKRKCREKDANLRGEISELLRRGGFSADVTKRLADWNPYDQNASAEFFDPEWMFGIKEGFDVVIANPPYIFARESQKKGLTDQDKKYFYEHYELAEYQVNLYPLFIEKGTRLLKPNGCLCFITPNNWLTINTNKKLRKFVLGQSHITIVNFYAQVFESADVDSSIIIFKKSDDKRNVRLFEYTDGFQFIKEANCDFFLKQRDYVINIESFKAAGVTELTARIESNSLCLKDVSDVKVGLGAYGLARGIPPTNRADD